MGAADEEIKQWLEGEAPSAERVAELRREMPWWLMPAAMRLRNARDLTAAERTELTGRLATLTSAIEQTSMAVNSDLRADLAGFYPPELPDTPDTEQTIEKFISTYGSADSVGEASVIERLIFNPVPDYAQLLAKEEEQSVPQPDEAPEGSADAMINSFIIKSKAVGGQFPSTQKEEMAEERVQPEAPVQKPAESDDSMLSESLAQIYIKRGKFSRAYEIISHLNLNFPEKSIYFADQLRFLGRLIALEERKNASKHQE